MYNTLITVSWFISKSSTI